MQLYGDRSLSTCGIFTLFIDSASACPTLPQLTDGVENASMSQSHHDGLQLVLSNSHDTNIFLVPQCLDLPHFHEMWLLYKFD